MPTYQFEYRIIQTGKVKIEADDEAQARTRFAEYPNLLALTFHPQREIVSVTETEPDETEEEDC